jgi:hypothetical protein
VAVSTISLAADSIAEVSYAFRRIRILLWLAAAMEVALLISWCGRVVLMLVRALAAVLHRRERLPPSPSGWREQAGSVRGNPRRRRHTAAVG